MFNKLQKIFVQNMNYQKNVLLIYQNAFNNKFKIISKKKFKINKKLNRSNLNKISLNLIYQYKKHMKSGSS